MEPTEFKVGDLVGVMKSKKSRQVEYYGEIVRIDCGKYFIRRKAPWGVTSCRVSGELLSRTEVDYRK